MFAKIKNLIKDEKSREKNGVTPQKSPREECKTEENYQNPQFYYTLPNLSLSRVPNLNSVYYLPEFISESFENSLLKFIYAPSNSSRWHELKYSSRRLQKYGGNVTNSGLEDLEPFPPILQSLAKSLMDNKIFPPETESDSSIELNHYLINEYPAGIGIMPHTDGPLYYPYVIILSLGSHCVFEFYKDYAGYKSEESVGKLLIEPRSLLIFTGECYSEYLHCIQDRKVDDVWVKDLKSNVDNIKLTAMFMKKGEEDFVESIEREKRISLTIRHVPRAKKENYSSCNKSDSKTDQNKWIAENVCLLELNIFF